MLPGQQGGESGQATVELALCLPIIALLLLLVIQVALLGRAVLLVGHAAREGARVAAVDPDPGAIGVAVRATPGLDPRRLQWVRGARVQGRPVRVVVRYRFDTGVPLVGALLPDPTIRAALSTYVEVGEG